MNDPYLIFQFVSVEFIKTKNYKIYLCEIKKTSKEGGNGGRKGRVVWYN